MEDFKKEDYIYLRLIDDYKTKTGVVLKKGEIIRQKKDELIKKIAGRHFNEVFNYDNKLIYEENNDCNEDDFLYHKIYKSITVPKDRWCDLCLWKGDYLYLNDWLLEHLDEESINILKNTSKDVIPDKANSNNFIELKDYGNPHITIYFKKGEKLDFTNPAVVTLFYYMDWIKFLANTEIISGKEKQEMFDEDFSNAIYAQRPSIAYFYKDDPNSDLEEFHYFKINDDIRIKKIEKLEEKTGNYLSFLKPIYDNEGFIKYVYIDGNYRDKEQLVLKFAHRIPSSEAYKLHQKVIEDYIKEEEKEIEEIEKKRIKEEQELEELYKIQKDNPLYFPGNNGNFVHNENESDDKEESYTLEQIKKFYQKLKTLDSDIVKEMCFYGGTVPYILTDAEKSRNFKDIDIFFPASKMEQLREELSKQKSFEMIYDSKPLAQFCNLTTRIEKDKKDLVNKEDQEKELFGLMFNIMNSKDDTEYDNEYNPIREFYNRNRPYYQKIQDFGFKAKLFGINISVFPMYQYDNDIMAKSFNVNDLYRFLLGVRILNNTSIDDFVKNVKLYDSAFKVLPLEYTLVSKQSAVDQKYLSRSEKDKEDIEYILSHKEELGIDEEKLKQILNNYPDYSISIAYRVNDTKTTTTMSGDTYKKLVLKNINIS